MTLFATVPNRRFGVEIEFVGVSPGIAATAISNAGVPCVYEDYNHTTRNHWKIVRDGSIEYHNSNCGELVSPPLVGAAGIEQVRNVLRALVSAGATVNRSCGLHVHVDANDLTIPQIVNVMRRYQNFQNVINTFMPVSRHNSRWAKNLSNDLINRVSSYMVSSSLRRNANALDRYHVINVASFARHGTIEFRQHSASVNNNKVAHWIAFCLFFVSESVTNLPGVIHRANSTGRGRRPNYAARNVIVALLSQPGGATLSSMASRTGYSENTIQGSILSQLRGMGRIRLTRWNGCYSFSSINHDALEVWLGNASTPVVSAPVPAMDASTNDALADTLFRGVPNEIVSFYNERAMELSQS